MQTQDSAMIHNFELKHRSELHISRKLAHAAGISFIVGLYYALPRDWAIYLSVSCLGIFLPIDFFRLRMSHLNLWFMQRFGKLMRQNEKEGLTGTAYLLLALVLLVLFFPKNISLLALLMLAIGDPLASIIGVLYGKDKLIGSKSLQGTLAAFVSCTIVSFFFYYGFNLMTERIVLVSVLSGLIAAVSELFTFGKLDDNFTFPVMAAVLLYILFHIFGGFS